MKSLILISSLFFSLTAAAINCDVYYLMPNIDGMGFVSQKIVQEFEKKGYNFTKINSLMEIEEDEGSISYMTIFSDVHRSFGAKTKIDIKTLNLDNDDFKETSRTLMTYTKNPIFGPPVKSLVRKVKRNIPACSK